MGKVYEHKNLAIKWCLQRVFKDVYLALSSQAYPEPAFCQQPTLYYGFSKETRIDTLEEYIPVPFNLFKIIKFAGDEAKKKEKYLLKPLSRELYDKLRKLYPHRQGDLFQVWVDYEKILSFNKGSLFNEFKEKKHEDILDMLDYCKWEEKILQYIQCKRWEDAILLLNHLFMGNVDDPPEKLRQEFRTRYCREFRIDPDIASFNVLVVDDFFFLHIYQFSLLERYHACYEETNSFMVPKVHFDFECIAEAAIEKIDNDGDKYSLILLDIDFGQQQKNCQDVIEIAQRKKIPFCNFSKFDLAKEYAPFQKKSYALPWIVKNLDYDEMSKELQERLERSQGIKIGVEQIKKAKELQRELLPPEGKYPQIKGIDPWGYNFSDYISSGYYQFFENKGPQCPFIFAFAYLDYKFGVIHAPYDITNKLTRLDAGLEAILSEKPDNPEQIVNRLHEVLIKKNLAKEWWITFFYGELNLFLHELHYIYAVHSEKPFSLFVISTSGEIRNLERNTDNVLGLYPGTGYMRNTIKITKGDILCLCTYGVKKVKNSRGEEFGIDRLKKAIRDNRSLKAEDIGERVRRELDRFTGGIEKKDGIDVTLLIIKYEYE